MDEEIDDVIRSLERWHRVRGDINARTGRKRELHMDTLPRTIELLKKLRAERGEAAHNT